MQLDYVRFFGLFLQQLQLPVSEREKNFTTPMIPPSVTEGRLLAQPLSDDSSPHGLSETTAADHSASSPSSMTQVSCEDIATGNSAPMLPLPIRREDEMDALRKDHLQSNGSRQPRRSPRLQAAKRAITDEHDVCAVDLVDLSYLGLSPEYSENVYRPLLSIIPAYVASVDLELVFDIEMSQETKMSLAMKTEILHKIYSVREERPKIRPMVEISPVPSSVKDLHQRPDRELWREAMLCEMGAIENHLVYELVPLPEGRKAVSNKWVFTIKDDGRYKARLVARGFTQMPGIDYRDTYAPVGKHTTFRILVALASMKDWHIHQMDVKTAFLHAELEEDIYMTQPEGFIDKSCPNHVWKLNKSLYGLKQAPREWYFELRDYLLELGLVRCDLDYSLFLLYQGGKLILAVLVYVDDMAIFGKDEEVIKTFKERLTERFEMKDLGELKKFIGLEIRRNRRLKQIHLSQADYISEILENENLTNVKSTRTPAETTPNELEPGEINDNREYQSKIGKLLYLTGGSRPDITYITSVLCRFMRCSTQKHWEAHKRLLRYLAGTKDLGILYDGSSDVIEIKGYSDASFGRDVATRKSVSGILFTFNGAPICWSSKRQETVARSTTDAEYTALTATCAEGIWISQLLQQLVEEFQGPIQLLCDNQGAIATAKDSATPKMKHIDTQKHFIRNQVERQLVTISYVRTNEMLADLLTKPLPIEPFERIRSQMSITSTELKGWEPKGGVGK